MRIIIFLFVLSLIFGDQCYADSTIGCSSGSSCTTVNRCPRYTEGYNRDVWKYTCISGKWESITCVQLAPENFKYPSSEYSFILNQPIATITPTIYCYQCVFRIKGVSPNTPAVLPAGIHFSESDGSFSGTPTSVMEKTEYTIIGRAEEAAADTEFTLSMRVIEKEGIESLNICGTWSGRTADEHAMRVDIKGLGEKDTNITQFEYSYNYFKTSDCKNKDRTVSVKYICTLPTDGNGNVTCSDPTFESYLDKPILDGVFVTNAGDLYYNDIEFERQSDDGCSAVTPSNSAFSVVQLVIVIGVMFIVIVIMFILIIILIVKLTKKEKKNMLKTVSKMTVFNLCYKQTL